jgi:N-methylhydantoinase A
VVDGPALVVENETTTYVASEFRARVSRLGALILDDVRLAEAAQ